MGSSMNRRAFFATLLGGTALAADPERLLWVPGRKLISIPRPPLLRVGDVFTISGRFAVNPVTRQQMPFLQRFMATDDVYEGGPSVKLWPLPLPSSTQLQTVSGDWLRRRMRLRA